jgi:hypothetical protein
MPIAALSAREKQKVIAAFTAALGDKVLAARLRQATRAERPLTAVAAALIDQPAELCAWHEHVERICAAAAVEFRSEREIGIAPRLSANVELDASLAIN